MEFLSSPELASQLTALGQVLMMDLVLAGDNAVAVGLAAAALPVEQRRKAILIGLIAAVAMRIGFALITVQLLAFVGLLLAGGILLLWVCWKMWRELQEQKTHNQAEAEAELERALAIERGEGPSPEELGIKRKSFGAALVQIMVADVTMSLDNVLAVAGAAHQHPWIMVFGLILSIALMGVAATFIARLLHRYRWIGYIGLIVVLYVALHMIWDGSRQVVVRTGHLEEYNASAPAFLEIGPEEAAHHWGQARSGDSRLPAPAEPAGAPAPSP
jgi:YjbE family integral membrane protein